VGDGREGFGRVRGADVGEFFTRDDVFCNDHRLDCVLMFN
jgi:hypothetical protein